jgi:hypothetical protein
VSTADDRERPHAPRGLADELRALALLALDRVDPLLARVREHPELIEWSADRAAGLLVVLREALDGQQDVSPPASPQPQPTRPRVQRIPVERIPVEPTGNGAPC